MLFDPADFDQSVDPSVQIDRKDICRAEIKYITVIAACDGNLIISCVFIISPSQNTGLGNGGTYLANGNRLGSCLIIELLFNFTDLKTVFIACGDHDRISSDFIDYSVFDKSVDRASQVKRG